MKDLFFSALSAQIGFTLLHSLWQGMIGVALIIILSRLISIKHSTIRYWLFVGIMLIVFITNISSFFFRGSGTNESTNIMAVSNLMENLGVAQLAAINASSPTIWINFVQESIPYFVMLWLLGIIALFMRMTINLWEIKQLSKKGYSSVSQDLSALFEQLKHRLKIDRAVKLVQAKHIIVPSVIGHLKPIILLPIGLMNGLSNDQVEAILLHELSHIKRHDYLVNIIQSIVEVLYFFNPFMWIISRKIRDERENASDDTAISLGVSPDVYAQTLASVFNYAINRRQFALSFASNNKLTLKRIQRIMKNKSNNNNKLMASMIFVVAITISMYYGAQSHIPGQDMPDMLTDQPVMAMALPNISLFSSTSTMKETSLEKLITEKFPQTAQIVVSDTTDPKELKKRTDAYEQAMENLKSTKEWQETEKLREEMVEEHIKFMTDFSPEFEDALRLTEETMALSEEQMMELDEKLAFMGEKLADLDINVELERIMEINTSEIEEAMSQIQDEMAKINFEEIENMSKMFAEDAKIMAKEAQAMAAEAALMAEEAKLQAEAAEGFLDELKPLLVEDGYIKSPKDLDQLKFKNGEVYINGEKVKSKDAKKYSKIHDKYFDSDDDFIMN